MKTPAKISVFSFITLIMLLLMGPSDIYTPDRSLSCLQSDTLIAGIKIPEGIYLRHGHAAGFHYDLLKRFSAKAKCQVNIRPCRSEDPWKMLIEGEMDIIVADSENDTIPEVYQAEVISSIDLNREKQVWVVRREDYQLLESMNQWFGTFKQTKEYSDLSSRYHRNLAAPGIKFFSGNKFLSPYDTLIRKYSATIDWDWRLLASLIYQESKFSMEARSSRGAHGLMQIRQATAKEFNIENIYDPEQNIKAGTLMIRRLSRMYSGLSLDSLNALKFVLAAYNAGEGRVEDLRKFAKHQGADPNNWESVASVIPSMRYSENIPTGLLRLGAFNGRETIRFVDEILERYEYYKEFI